LIKFQIEKQKTSRMTNPFVSSTSHPSSEDSFDRAGDDKVPQECGDEEVPQEGGESEVPYEDGESEGPIRECSVDEAPAVDQHFEDLSLAGVDALAGPSGVQPQVVVQQVAAVTGGGDDPPELCEYEKLRERNIRERDEAMKEAMEEIEEAKQDMRDNAPGAKKRAAEEEDGGTRKRKKVEPVVEVRRSGRERKPVTYVVNEDLDGRSRKRGRQMGGGRSNAVSKTPVRFGRGKMSSKPDTSPVLPSSSRTLRPRKPIDYSEVPEPEADGFIWCSTCGKEEYNGCEKHITYFGDNKEFKLEVEKSSVGGSHAGEGVFNRGEVIPEGVLFGPYTGKFIPAAEYEEIKKAKVESGNAWEIRDNNNKIVGYIDPGMNPDPQLHWMAKINCPTKTPEQNLVGFQLAGQIYYRVIMDIPYGKELLVWYGKTYAEEIGIEIETVDKYTGNEDHTEEAVKCEHCGTGMDGEKMEEHLGKGDNGSFRCQVKQAKEMVRMAVSGERKHVCKVCGKGFKTKQYLFNHVNSHAKVKAFKCEVEGCDKSYAGNGGLFTHKKIVHEGEYYECPECGKRFGEKGNMTRHYKMVHEEERNYKCEKCGVQFALSSDLARHIKTVHEKIRAFKCEHCGKSFGMASHRKQHFEGVHSNIRYPCTWQGCTWTTTLKSMVKFHVRRVHTKEWSWECQLCEDQLDIWWGCIQPKEMKKHRAKKHPVEWEEEQEAYRRDHPFICKYKKCLNRYKTEVEKDRHQEKMH
jgi:DNA-directed RNA polymerase subunit RPC12/RpoP